MTTTERPSTADNAPPHDLHAEQAALGAMMMSAAIADELTEIIDREDFYRPAHATVFDAITKLIGKGHKADPIAVHDTLADDALRVGGFDYLHTLIAACPVSMNGGYYARIVAEKATRRRIGEAGAKITRLAVSPEPIEEIIDRTAQTAFDATTDRRSTPAVQHVGQTIGPVLEQIARLAAGEIEAGIPTGLHDVDRLTGGMHPGQLWIPAGRTGMGKSVITQNWIRHAVEHTGRPGILFSVEMSITEMTQRLLSEIAQVPLTRIREGKLIPPDHDKIATAQRILHELPLYLVDNVRTVPGIRAATRRFKHRMGDCCVVGVDYLQRLQGLDRRHERHQEVGAFADGLKDLAQDMELPVIAPCQLNRGPENRTGKDANLPRLADLRESGNLEQTADVVALLYRPEYYDSDTKRPAEADIDLAKNRNGPTEKVTVGAWMNIQTFGDR